MSACCNIHNGPTVRINMFWEFDVARMDWLDGYCTVIQRVLERGTKKEWQELITFYGWEKVVTCTTREISYLPDDIIEEASYFFNLREEDFRCYHRKPFLPGHWI